ncbi:MAG TPA: CHASE4 domain-containing protein, partial [Holophaga sp.]|nr:CHASE4 domain-containing protein [Holophaga sp.]
MVVAAGCLLALLIAWLPGRMVLRQSCDLERKSLNRDTNRVVLELGNEVRILGALARDWASWDDTYSFIQDHNAYFIHANLQWASLFGSTRINFLSFVDGQGRVVWTGFRRSLSEPPLQVPPDLARGPEEPATEGFILTPEGPLVWARREIVHSDGSGPVRGMLLMGRLLDQATLSDIIHRVGLPFQVQDTLRTPASALAGELAEHLRNGGYDVHYTPEVATIHTFV